MLQRLFHQNYPLLVPWVPLLGQLLPLSATDSVGDTEQSRAAGANGDECKIIVRGLLVAMLRIIAQTRPTVVALDDAQCVVLQIIIVVFGGVLVA